MKTDVQRDGAAEEMTSTAPVVKPALAVPPTLKGIAQIAGCSTAVVSTVLNKSRGNTQVSEATREKILAIAGELNYRPNLTARSMKSRKSLIIGVLVRNNSRVDYAEMGAHPLAYELVLGINEGLEARGYMMSLVRLSDIDPAKHFQASAFQGHLLDGLIVVNQVPAAPRERLEALLPQCVWLDTNVWGPTHCVRRDEQHAGYSVGQQMAALGYCDWLLLSYGDDEAQAEEHYSHTQRLSGVQAAAQEHGASLRYWKVPWNSPRREEELARFTEQLSPTTAVIAQDIYIAQTLANTLVMRGMRPGTDFALACCDDHFGGAGLNWPELARMSFNRFHMGRDAAQLMLQTLENPDAPPPSQIVTGEWLAGPTAPPCP